MVVKKLPGAGSMLMVYDQKTRNEYDHQGRLLNTYHKINSGAEKTLASLLYNELGQLLAKKLHVTSGTGLQKTDYTYNIRGWLKKINEPDLSGGEGDFFGAELLYNEGFEALNGTAMNGAAMYNGNISGIKWKNGSSGSTQKGYGFIYDQINRLTTSKYGEGTSYTTNVNRYDENLTYDKNGNIRKLFRNGQISTGVFGNIDSLGYKYPGTGNQFWATGYIVTDVAGRGDFFDGTNGYSTKEYYYDKNGNIWLDRNKKMKTVYNYLNLPARISDTVNTTYKIEYVYTSAGEKLKQRLSTGTTLLYNGNFVYTLDGTANGIAVKYILTQEGRSTNSTGTYTYEYFMKDHLGNIRINFKDSSNVAVIIQQSDYYPFGMIHQPQATTTSDNRYLYNGKELLDESLGGVNLDLYDFQTRFYDPQIARWHVIDPLASEAPSWSPYNALWNNPILNVDLNGAWANPVFGSDGTFRGNTIEGYTGAVIIYNGDKDFTKMSANDLLYNENFDISTQKGEANTYDRVRSELTGDAKSKIWTNIASELEGEQIYDEKFSLSSLSNGKISYSSTDPGSWNSRIKSKTITGTDKYSYETTVENIQSSLVVHEWYSHIQKGNSDELKSHRLAFKNVINYKDLWDKTTDAYKGFNLRQLFNYTKSETGKTQIDPLYKNLYEQYKNKR